MISLANWARTHFPTREALERNRWVRPFAHRVLRADLWRFNRRSVPRAIALGFFTGVMIPFAHSFIAAVTAVAVRANVPVAIAATWISNPFTWVLMWPAAYKIGNFLLRVDAVTPVQPITHAMAATGSDHLLTRLTGAGLATAFGLFVEATVIATIGYLVSAAVWRARVARQRKRRIAAARQRRAALAAGA
ncbi:MAG: DUF2062 domain-containing protein [Sphingomonadales bacterium]|nr:DUF2062 domain-containing protein [Sphingomonadales bacterium]